jgi:hypothetical protein
MGTSRGRRRAGRRGVIAAALCALCLSAASRAEAACPNEAFRPDEASAAALGLAYPGAELPDCRGFEQATPIDKNGGDASGTLPYAKAATQGGGIAFISLSGIGGGVGGQDIPSYLASRGEGTWSTNGMLPPAGEGQQADVLGWTPDFSEVFTKATRLGNPSETELLMRPGTGGPPTQVVGYTTGLEPSFAATTEDGSLLFESPAKLLPAAVPGHPNVYLWDRGSEEVSLVGVLNDKKAPTQGTIAGPYDWIKGTNSATLAEGGGKRQYYTEEEHAIARDGSAAYFTAAGSGKLYVRLNPAAQPSQLNGEGKCTEAASKACTIEISASEKTNGTGPGGTELGAPRPAAFQAASENGKVSYFTSSEELTNQSNTGPEATELPPPATISRAKIGPTKAEEIEHGCIEGRASSLATDETYIYWAEREAGAIGRAKLDCSEPPEPNFITGLPGIEDLAVDAGHIYWTEPTDNAIGRAEIDGNPASVETEFIAGTAGPKGVASGCGHLYWTNAGGHSLGRATLGAGGAEEVEQSFVKFEEAGKKVPGQGVAADCAGGHIYVTIEGHGVWILRYELNGTKDPQETEFSELAGEPGLALDGAHIYWNQEGAGEHVYSSRISRANLDLGEVEEEFIKESEGVEDAQSVAVASGHVYWANDPPESTKPGNDLYRYDATAPEGQRLSDLTAETTGNGAEVLGVLDGSADGSVVYFAANGDLDGTGPGEAGTCAGRLGSASGTCDLYRWEAGEAKPTFVAQLDLGGDESKTDAVDWAATSTGVFTGQFQRTARVSGDGATLLFRSQEGLTTYDNEGVAELYLYRQGKGVACVSCDPSGAAPVGEPDLGNAFPGPSLIPPTPAAFANHNLASGGGRAFFETPDALVAVDTNGEGGCPLVGGVQKHFACMDVYEWEEAGEGSCLEASPAYSPQDQGCIYLLSSGKSTEPALLADASESGGDVFFFDRQRFVGQDEDELIDVYDVREGGGLAAQYPPPPPPPCESPEACHGPAQSAPAEGSPGSAGFQGPGNPAPKRNGKKRQHKKKRHGHRQRRAQSKRRAGR